MSLPVHFVPTLTGVSAGTSVEVTGDEAHHAVAVRRLRVGEQVVLTDGAGTSVVGSVSSTGKRVFTVAVESLKVVERAQPAVTVVQAIPKGDRADLAVEVLTEIGVDAIVPWAAARCVAVWRGERVEKSHAKWQATAHEAAKQARRTFFPTVFPMASTADVVALIADADLAVVLHENASLPLASLEVPNEGHLVIVVGPEGGVSEEEITSFHEAGAMTARLGDEVLRTSTAGLAAASVLLSRTSRWS